jgi:uncharacterized protein YcfJ
MHIHFRRFSMKHQAMTLALLATAAWGQAHAQEVGQVISRTAVFQLVTVPHQTCTQTPALVRSSNSGGGALMGALAGGAMGNAVGDGSGRALATMIGIVGGAMVGDRIEGHGTTLQNHTTCTTQNVQENRLVGYHVVYEYAGKHHSVQLPHDPGPTLALNITPQVQGLQTEVPLPTPMRAQVVTLSPQLVVVPAPVYRVSSPPLVTHIDLRWSHPRPMVQQHIYHAPAPNRHVERRHVERRHDERRGPPRHAARQEHGHWR